MNNYYLNWIAKKKRNRWRNLWLRETYKTYQSAIYGDYLDLDLNKCKNTYIYETTGEIWILTENVAMLKYFRLYLGLIRYVVMSF